MNPWKDNRKHKYNCCISASNTRKTGRKSSNKHHKKLHQTLKQQQQLQLTPLFPLLSKIRCQARNPSIIFISKVHTVWFVRVSKQVTVIEAREMRSTLGESCLQPFVTAKLNGKDWVNKQKTKSKNSPNCNQQHQNWWEHLFRLYVTTLFYYSSFLTSSVSKIRDIHSEWVSVEVRDKGNHLMRSDAIGEIQLQIRNFKVCNLATNL